MKVTIVGSGLSGIVAAIQLKEKGHQVEIFENRTHIGGNCYDSNLCGTLVHNYGPHIFHTDDDGVFDFLSRYTDWMEFGYRPKAQTSRGLFSIPYSKKTISEIGYELSQEEIVKLFFRDYSEKQWGVPFDRIPSWITNRVPKTKDCEDPTWFEGQKYQCIPKAGYTKMMENMLEGITVHLNTGLNEWRKYPRDLTVFTGRIDQYFDYQLGLMPYRTLMFEHRTVPTGVPGYCVINQTNRNTQYTRRYDHSYFSEPKEFQTTIVTFETPYNCPEDGIPFYPMPFGKGLDMYEQYKELANNENNVIFLGRLAQYKYLDMWMAIRAALLTIERV